MVCCKLVSTSFTYRFVLFREYEAVQVCACPMWRQHKIPSVKCSWCRHNFYSHKRDFIRCSLLCTFLSYVAYHFNYYDLTSRILFAACLLLISTVASLCSTCVSCLITTYYNMTRDPAETMLQVCAAHVSALSLPLITMWLRTQQTLRYVLAWWLLLYCVWCLLVRVLLYLWSVVL